MEQEIRPILKKKKEIGDHLRMFKLSWIFEKPIEKILLVAMILLGVWKIADFFI